MNDSPFTTIGDEPVEARIVAWVLGEASAFEAAELERLCEERPELLVFRRRMRALHGLLTEAEAAQPDEGWKLPPEKRQKLDEVFGEKKPVTANPVIEKRIRHSGRRAFLAIAACLMLAFLVMRLIPWKYESETIVEVKPRNLGISPFGNQMSESPEPGKLTPQFFGTEFEKIKSRHSLEKVVDNLELETRWKVDKETALGILKDNIITQNIDGTDLISIRVRNANKQDAQDIAVEVTKSYQAHRAEIESKEEDRNLHEFNKAVRDQEDKVEERRKVLATIERTKGITYKGSATVSGQPNGDGSREDALKRGLDAQDYVDAKRDFEADQELLKTMKLKLIAETIATKMSGPSVEVHEQPSSVKMVPLATRLFEGIGGGSKPSNDQLASAGDRKAAHSSSEKMVSLATNLPPELIEGTPKPMNVPNLEPPANGPAGWSSRGLASESPAKKPSSTTTPSAMADVPKLDDSAEGVAELAGERSLDEIRRRKITLPAQPNAKRVFAASETPRPNLPPADNFAALDASPSPAAAPPVIASPASPAEPQARPQRVAAAKSDGKPAKENQPAGPEIAKNAESDGDPFADESVFSSRLAARQPLAKAGAGTLAIPSDIGDAGGSGPMPGDDLAEFNTSGNRIEGEKSLFEEKKLEQADKVPVLGDVPTLGRLFSDGDKSDPAEGSGFGGKLDGTTTLSGTNTYTGGSSVNGGVLGGGGLATDAPRFSFDIRAGASRVTPSEDIVFTDPDGTAEKLQIPKITTRSVGKDVEELDDAIRTNPALAGDPQAKKNTEFEGFVEYGASIKKLPPVRGTIVDRAAEDQNGLEAAEKVDPEWDTSKAVSKNKDSKSGVEYELDTGYKSEYLFRGVDLGGSETLRKAIKDQEDKVEERRKVLSTIVRTKGIIYEGTDSFYAQSGVDEDQGAKNAIQTFHQLEQEKTQLEKQLGALEDTGERQTAAEANHRKATLKAQLDVANDRLKAVQVMKDQTRDEAIKRGLDAQDYMDAKRDFEKDQALLQQMKLKLTGELAAPEPEPEPPKPNLAELMEEIVATEDPYSTFSLNISDASFQVAQAALAKGERPDPAGIKVEQFYNAVDYGDPAPTSGEPVAHAIEQSAHPVIPGRNLVRVALKTGSAGRAASQPLRLTLLVDQSGSMVREDRRAAMEKALAGLTGLLTKSDLVNVIGFSRTPRLLADGWTGDQAGKLAELVNQTANEGGTNLEEAIKLAEQLAERRKLAGAQNRIVLFTDGAANLGNADPLRLAEKVKALRQKGIAFDIAGIAADGLNDDLLGELARNGNGRYYVVGKGADENFAKQLAGAFRPAAENVKVQVHFNPERVGRYKLIGFEKDRLKTEDFRNDAVDAAELAAEEAGVAVYQIEPLPGGSGELGEVSVRFRDTAKGEMVERTWTIPHDASAPAFDRATPSMQLAVLSMLAAEKLRGGPLAEAIDFKQLGQTRANVKQFYGNSGRVAEVLRMIDSLQ